VLVELVLVELVLIELVLIELGAGTTPELAGVGDARRIGEAVTCTTARKDTFSPAASTVSAAGSAPPPTSRRSDTRTPESIPADTSCAHARSSGTRCGAAAA